MRRFELFASIFAILFVGCSLAEDVTPPPALATAPEASPVVSPIGESLTPTPQATVERKESELMQEPTTISLGETPLGTIYGRVINGTTGETVTAGTEVHLIGVDSQAIMLSEVSSTGAGGEFAFENLEIVPGRIFGIYTEYQGVEYFSEGRQFSGDDDGETIDLQVTIYEVTPETGTVHVDRLHLMFDFIAEGLVDVMEIWVISNQGNQTVASSGDQQGLEFILPSGLDNLRFFSDGVSEGRFLLTEGGFIDREPLRPMDGTQLAFSFTLPYQRHLEFAQPIAFPVGATVILMPEKGPEVNANGLRDLGVGDIGDVRRKIYDLGPILAGDTLVLELSGSPLSSEGEATRLGLIIGAAVFGVALITSGAWWYRVRLRDGAKELAKGKIPSDQEELLSAIAALDDSFDAGEVSEGVYRRQRQILKQQLMDLMREAHD